MHPVTVVQNLSAGQDQRLLVLAEALGDHTRPGQFVAVHVPGHKPAWFAIASLPGQPIELLVKVPGEVASILAAMAPGATFQVSDPMGKGFPLERVLGQPLVVLATGSGISAVRPVIAAEVAAGLPRPVTLYYGIRSEEGRAFTDDLVAWTRAGVEVHVVISRPGEEWTGPIGYVQHFARERGDVRGGVGVVLCGQKAMAEEVRALYEAEGLSPEHLLTNF